MGDKSSPMFGWRRCAAICAIVSSMTACVPPNPAWQSAGPEESASTYDKEGNDLADEDGAEDAPSTEAYGDQTESPTAKGYAPPGKTCAAACRRFAECKFFSFEGCMKECGKQGAEGTAEGRRTNLVQARSSCRSLAAAMPSDWLCTAEGESVYGYDVDTEPSINAEGTSSVHLFGQGKTRADAEYSALRDCNAMMTTNLSIDGSMNMDPSPRGSWGSAISSPCHITQCIAPARARDESSDR